MMHHALLSFPNRLLTDAHSHPGVRAFVFFKKTKQKEDEEKEIQHFIYGLK